MRKILVTGSTGFLGAFLSLGLLKEPSNRLYFLVRGQTDCDCVQRITGALRRASGGEDVYASKREQIRIIKGDVSIPQLGLDRDIFNKLAKELDEIYHCAAITDFIYPLEVIKNVNSNGVERIIKLVQAGSASGNTIRVNILSTVYVVGSANGRSIFYEDELEIQQGFHNSYEESKFEGEKIAHHYRRQGIPVTIFRTSVLVGDTKSAIAINMRSFYQMIKLIGSGMFAEIPANPLSRVNLIPVDEAVGRILKICLADGYDGKTYHIVNDEDARLDDIINWAGDILHFKKPKYLDADDTRFISYSTAQRLALNPFVPYMNFSISFDTRNVKQIMGLDYQATSVINKVFLRHILHSNFTEKKQVPVA